jgi:CheY-like chemotaxis protein
MTVYSSGKRVLIIEDSLDTAQTLTFLLRDSGHFVECAINGYAGLEIAARQRPNVIFLDIGLPDFDGITLARKLRQLPGLDETRIIAVTGRVSDDEQRALEAGCELFLRKPIRPEALEAILGQMPTAPDGLYSLPKQLRKH